MSPIAATGVTGFSLIADSSNAFSTSTQVVGSVFAADYTAPTPASLTTATLDMEAAYTDATAAYRLDESKVELGGGSVGGMTFTPGVYTWTTLIDVGANIYMDGGPNDVFILRTTKIIIFAAKVNIFLTGGAQAKNVYWVAAESVIVMAEAHVEGIIFTYTNAVFVTGASLQGRVFAQTAVTLQKATVTAP